MFVSYVQTEFLFMENIENSLNECVFIENLLGSRYFVTTW